MLLLDEPLGALDAQLRKNLQVELKALQGELGVTFVFVTHDQEEALTMSDRIAVMNNGRVEQAASPRAIYEEPETVFVADFLGVSNLLPAEAVGPDGAACMVRVGDRTLRAQQGAIDARGDGEGDDPAGAHRHRAARQHRRPADARHRRALGLPRRLARGAHPRARRRAAQGDGLKRRQEAAASLEPGAAVSVYLPPDALRVLTTSEAAEEAEGEQQEEAPAAGDPTASITQA